MPTDGRHFNYPLITVSGTCGDAAYVVILRNSIETGRAPCSTGAFSLQVQLSVGANQLRATSYNVTDNEGPPSAPITVYYDLLIPDPGLPPHATTELRITSVEGVPYIPGRLYRTSSQPTIQGTAAPFSIVTITFSPGGAICSVRANAQGQWGCKLTPKLAGGRYQVATSSLSPQNTHSSLAAFAIIVSDLITPKPPGIIPGGDLSILYTPDGYRTYLPGELWRGRFSIIGGTPPYSLEIDWRDDEVSGYAIADSNKFEVSHVYQKFGTYQPIVHATDSRGASASLMFFVIVTSPPGVADIASATPAPLLLFAILTVTIITLFVFFLKQMQSLYRLVRSLKDRT